MRWDIFRTCLRHALGALWRPTPEPVPEPEPESQPDLRARPQAMNALTPWEFAIDDMHIYGWRTMDATAILPASAIPPPETN